MRVHSTSREPHRPSQALGSVSAGLKEAARPAPYGLWDGERAFDPRFDRVVAISIRGEHCGRGCRYLTAMERVLPATPHLPVLLEQGELVGAQGLQPIAWGLGVNVSLKDEGVRSALKICDAVQDAVVVPQDAVTLSAVIADPDPTRRSTASPSSPSSSNDLLHARPNFRPNPPCARALHTHPRPIQPAAQSVEVCSSRARRMMTWSSGCGRRRVSTPANRD